MIGRISGKIDYILDDHILLNVGGISYIVYVTQATISNLPKLGDQISLFTELIVKEDLLQLVGFVTNEELVWYKLLTSVQGVGSKAALALLSYIPIKTISRAILLEDSNTITAAQGIGPKIAKRIVVELKSKVPNMLKFNKNLDITINKNPKLSETNTDLTEKNNSLTYVDNNINKKEIDAISALVNLGYSQLDASQVIAKVTDMSDKELDVEQLIRISLKTLISKG